MTARRLAAILAADVVGYSKLIGEDEAGTLAALREIRRGIVNPVMTDHGGRIFKLMGDGLLAEFPSAVEAVRAAIGIQEGIRQRNAGLSSGRSIDVRIGVHQGDVVVEGMDLLGDGVNIAARLEALAEPGGICISGRVHEDAAGKITLDAQDLGEQSLKNIARPVRAYRVSVVSARSSAREQTAERPILPLPDKPSIAVLPFQNMSGDPEQEYFADGMVEDIISGLSRISWLFVIARNSSFTYKGKTVDVKQVGRELGVRYVLEGSVRKSGARLRITGQLIDATTGGHIWADRFDGALEDVFDLQDQITASVVGTIEPRLQRAEIERACRKPTENLDAYDYFLRAMASFHHLTKDSTREAKRLYQHAIELDPSYASAYGMAAWCVVHLKTNGWLVDPEREIAEGVKLARQAAASGKDDPTALWSSGDSLAYLAGEVEVGAIQVDRAIVLNPNLAMAWGVSGWLRVYLGQQANAIEHFERAMRLSPLDSFAYFSYAGMAYAHVLSERYDEAVFWSRKAINEQPNWATTLRIGAIAYALSGRVAEAREAIAGQLEIDPDLRVGNLQRVVGPYRQSEDTARLVKGMRLAGLPE
jgi:adenylate cyclase